MALIAMRSCTIHKIQKTESAKDVKSSLSKPSVTDDLQQLHNDLRSLCSLFHKISFLLDVDCPDDVGDQALRVFVRITKAIDQNDRTILHQGTFIGELKRLITSVNHLLSLKEVKDLAESQEMERLKSKLELFNSLSDLSGESQTWAINVLYVLRLDNLKFENSKILDSSPGNLDFLKREIECIWKDDIDESESDGKSLEKTLQSFGFSTSTSKEIASSVPNSIAACQSPLYWSIRYLKYRLFNEPLLAYMPRYPYQDSITNNPFQETIEDCQVDMLNVSSKEGGFQKIVERFLKDHSENSGFKLFYHGTSHSDAVSILQMGVQLSQGSIRQDFSSGDGFYLSENLEDAQLWAKAGRGECLYQAVIVYKLNLDKYEKEGLNLYGHDNTWQNIITLCRNPNANKFERMNFLSSYKFIRGPFCSNPITAIKNRKKFECGKINQLCIRDEDFVKSQCNTQNICCVIFY